MIPFTFILLANLAISATSAQRGLKIAEVGDSVFEHVSIPCNPAIVGSVAACFNQSIPSQGNLDYNLTDPKVSYPTDGSPWGVHITGPYPDGATYLVSYHSGAPTVGPANELPNPNTSKMSAFVRLRYGNRKQVIMKGVVITYKRHFINGIPKPDYFNNFGLPINVYNFSYLSSPISHVLLPNLMPSTTYTYSVGNGSLWSEEIKFTTLPSASSKTVYPLRIGVVGDIGQTVNSSQTRNHLSANKPQVIINVGDLTYADNFLPWDVPVSHAQLTHQRRWDSFIQLWTSLFSKVPQIHALGNHEMEMGNINAELNPSSTTFQYPSNYPFQAYSARFPAPGTKHNFGDINTNLWHSTIIAGKIKLVTLSSYTPFEPGSLQYKWFMSEMASFRRSVTPWLFVQVHAPVYHSYANHYKEAECFASVYEEIFYKYGVDLVINGHVHAYERTHPVYKYKLDNCGPVWLTIGDGGNVEGPYRNFVDEIDPATKKTFCEGLKNPDGKTPMETLDSGSSWTAYYQQIVQSPSCPTVTFQPAYGVAGGPGLVPMFDNNKSTPLYFCQSSQPIWSAHRDPSFGHAILEMLSDKSMKLSWYRNIDSKMKIADTVTLERLTSCKNRS